MDDGWRLADADAVLITDPSHQGVIDGSGDTPHEAGADVTLSLSSQLYRQPPSSRSNEHGNRLRFKL